MLLLLITLLSCSIPSFAAHTLVRMDSPFINFTGSWEFSDLTCKGGMIEGAISTNTSGAEFSFAFFGSSVDVILQTHNQGPKARVFVDDKLLHEQTTSLEGPNATWLTNSNCETSRVRVGEYNLPLAVHTIKLISGGMGQSVLVAADGSPGKLYVNGIMYTDEVSEKQISKRGLIGGTVGAAAFVIIVAVLAIHQRHRFIRSKPPKDVEGIQE